MQTPITIIDRVYYVGNAVSVYSLLRDLSVVDTGCSECVCVCLYVCDRMRVWEREGGR